MIRLWFTSPGAYAERNDQARAKKRALVRAKAVGKLSKTAILIDFEAI